VSYGPESRKPRGDDRRQRATKVEKRMPNMEEVAEKIYRLETPIPGMTTIFSVYLIPESEGVLIEPGPATARPQSREGMSD